MYKQGTEMNRQVKYDPIANKFLGIKKSGTGISVMQALETAVLLMEQAGCTEEDIMKYVHMIHMGWIRDGSLAPEYLELCRQVELEKRKEEDDLRKINALRESAQTSIIADYRK